MDIIKNASETIVNRLTWHTAERDQAGIADELAMVNSVAAVMKTKTILNRISLMR